MNKTCRSVLVTGGAGFIGSHIVPRLLELGHKVNVLDNLSTGARAPTSVNQLAATLKRVTGKNPKVKCGSARLGDVRSNYGDPVVGVLLLE
jgi:nucleoside-diphosphate-sugar epimerase